jgi:hypothetical protein
LLAPSLCARPRESSRFPSHFECDFSRPFLASLRARKISVAPSEAISASRSSPALRLSDFPTGSLWPLPVGFTRASHRVPPPSDHRARPLSPFEPPRAFHAHPGARLRSTLVSPVRATASPGVVRVGSASLRVAGVVNTHLARPSPTLGGDDRRRFRGTRALWDARAAAFALRVEISTPPRHLRRTNRPNTYLSVRARLAPPSALSCIEFRHCS